MKIVDRREALAALAGMAWVKPAAAGWAWSESAPEAQGMDPQVLGALVEFGRGEQMDSLLVARHGKIVSETYFGPFSAGMRHAVSSATSKAIVATLVGIAIERRLLPGTDVPALSFFPGREIDHVNAHKRAMTLQHLLDMRAGLDWSERLSNAPPVSLRQMRASPDWVQFVLDRPMALPLARSSTRAVATAI